MSKEQSTMIRTDRMPMLRLHCGELFIARPQECRSPQCWVESLRNPAYGTELIRHNVRDHRVAGVIIASIPAPSATSVHHIVMPRFHSFQLGFRQDSIGFAIRHLRLLSKARGLWLRAGLMHQFAQAIFQMNEAR